MKTFWETELEIWFGPVGKFRVHEFLVLFIDILSKGCLSLFNYRGSPDSTNFGPPGDRTIAKIVLSGD